jgi:hypothetical protein
MFHQAASIARAGGSMADSSIAPDSPLAIARELASRFARTAVARDQQGGTPRPNAMRCATAACWA